MSELRETIANIAHNVTKTSGDLIKTTKLSVNLSGEQEAIKRIYVDIGKKVHEIYSYGGSLGKFFDEQYAEIEACERRIDEIKAKINEIKGTRECLKCGKTVDRENEFCPKCGAPAPGQKNPVTFETADGVSAQAESNVTDRSLSRQENAAEPQAAVVVKCRVCGAENETTAKFCLSCGRII